MKIVLSSGHAKYVPGASGIIDEVEEARRVVDRTVERLIEMGVDAVGFHDNTSTSQDENLDAIVAFHNSQERELDVSIHFNCFQPTDGPRGTECLYVTQAALAEAMALAIANAGTLLNRDAVFRDDLAFLNGTTEPAILIEVCFVDSEADVQCYQKNFEAICSAIAQTVVNAETV